MHVLLYTLLQMYGHILYQLLLHTYTHTCVCVCPQRPEEDIRSPGAGVMSDCELSDVGAGT